MAAHSSSSSIAPTSQNYNNLQYLHDRLSSIAVQTVQEITSDTQQRLGHYKKDIQQIARGIFYANTYYHLLRETHQDARCKYLIDRGNFYHTLAPSSAFTPVENVSSPTGLSPCMFTLKNGTTPSAALKIFRQGLTFCGCGEVCQIGYYTAIQEILGAEKFNALFAAGSLTSLQIGLQIMLPNPINCLLKATTNQNNFSKGQIVLFGNVPYYPQKHINGEDHGFLAICCGEKAGQKVFTTLGLDPKGATEKEIQHELLKGYNEAPIGTAIVTDAVAKRLLKTYSLDDQKKTQSMEKHTISMQQFEKDGGGKALCCIDFHVERISALAQATIPQAKALFTLWYKQQPSFYGLQGHY